MILMTGAAGYVGSHVLRLFLERDEKCVVLDDLSTGYRAAIPNAVPFFQANVSDDKILTEIFESYPIHGILHFAGFIEVGESVTNPTKYFENNLVRSMPLLEKSKEHRTPWIVFSSSAAVYGEPTKVPIEESDPKEPNNPYGFTKWIFEEMLRAYDHAYQLRSISLRYFNAAGAHPSGDLGEAHNPESHLIPRVCKTALGQSDHISIYGNDYPTPDGTCIRDYVHIMDLAEAHWLAAKSLRGGHSTSAYNLGSEKGYSVKDVIDSVATATGRKIQTRIEKRRAGDSAVLVASSKAFQKEFSWNPKSHSLEKIVSSAWHWHERHPRGF